MSEAIGSDLIEQARKVALKSPCPKAKFGALIMLDGQIVAEGFNTPPAWPHDNCAEHCLREGVKSGTRLERCYALHAEQWAILSALKQGHDIEMAVLIVAGYDSKGNEWKKKEPSFYCTLCSRLILACNLRAVLIDTVDGPHLMYLGDVWETSYAVATGKMRANGTLQKESTDVPQ